MAPISNINVPQQDTFLERKHTPTYTYIRTVFGTQYPYDQHVLGVFDINILFNNHNVPLLYITPFHVGNIFTVRRKYIISQMQYKYLKCFEGKFTLRY